MSKPVSAPVSGPVRPRRPFIRTPYNYERDVVTRMSGVSCPEPTRAQQQFKEDSDPNKIVQRYLRTGDANLLNATSPQYGDFSGISDYQSALNAVLQAQESFSALPAKVRSRFRNDPALLVDFLRDPNNRKEAEELGILKPPSGAPRDTESAVGASGGGDQPKAGKPPVRPSKKPLRERVEAVLASIGDDADDA